MGKIRDYILFSIDAFVFLIGALGIYTWIKLGIFYSEHPLPFFGAIMQLICSYIWVRVRTMSEFIPQERMIVINFIAVIFSVIHTIYSTVILIFSYKDHNTMYQNEIYFGAYMVGWGVGLAQILIYLLWPQALTGVNYSIFQHSRDLTEEERETLDQLEEYLAGLSDSSESKGENLAEERGHSFDDLGLIHFRNYKNEQKEDTQFCSVCLDPVLEGERIVQTHCKHFFHRQCLKTSYEIGNNNCPNCRECLIGGSVILSKISDDNGLLNDSELTRSSFQMNED